MLQHLFAILGLVVLCAGWVLFQEWLKRVDPQKGEYRPGCGACGKDSCESENKKKVL